MKRLVFTAFALGFAIPVFAQPAPPAPNQELLQALQAQRNWALDMHAQASATVTKLQAEIEELKGRLAKAEKKE